MPENLKEKLTDVLGPQGYADYVAMHNQQYKFEVQHAVDGPMIAHYVLADEGDLNKIHTQCERVQTMTTFSPTGIEMGLLPRVVDTADASDLFEASVEAARDGDRWIITISARGEHGNPETHVCSEMKIAINDNQAIEVLQPITAVT